MSDNEYTTDLEDFEELFEELDEELDNGLERETSNILETSTNDNLENLNFRETSDITEISTDNNESSIDESSATTENNNQKKGGSPVWEFMFKQYDDEGKFIAIVCRLCKKEYGIKTSTSPLMSHLIKEHKRNVSIKQQSKLNFNKKPYSKDDAIRIKDCNDALLNFIIGYQLPFAIVNNKWLDEFCKTLDLRYRLPSRQYVQKQIINNFENRRMLVANELEKLKSKVSLTADIWTSISNQAYLGVTIHFIDEHWKMQCFLLDLIHFENSHTGVRTKAKLLQLLNEMHLNGKVLGFTTDNDSKMILCGNLLTTEFDNHEFKHYRCAAHVLNIAINHGMELKVEIISKVRLFVNKIRHSTLLCDSIRNFCTIIKKNYLKLEIDVCTRWNSTFLMLEKLVRMREELDFLVCSNKQLTNDYLKDEEWIQVQSIITLLEPMYKATKILSSSSYPTIGDVRLTFAGILQHIDLYKNNHTLEECIMADSIRHKLEEYWQILDESTTISTILNPCSKLLTFLSENQKNSAINLLRSKMRLYTSTQSNLNESTSNIINARSFFENLIMQQNERQPVEGELERYLALPLTQSEPLVWWSQYVDKFPVLSKMACNYLAIQGTSIPCEQAFSVASHTLTKIRNRLNPETARASLCLKSWMEQNIGIKK